jgi:hypothetical protein
MAERLAISIAPAFDPKGRPRHRLGMGETGGGRPGGGAGIAGKDAAKVVAEMPGESLVVVA